MEAAAVDENYENRRSFRRMRTLKKGRIVFSGGYSVFDCLVRNISNGGAMLQVGGLGIPSHFELIMDATVPRHPCTVRWRSQDAVGVSFDDVLEAA